MSKALAKKLGYTFLAVSIIVLVIFRGKVYEGLGTKYLWVKDQQAVKIDKSDPEWLDKYCKLEIKNLPKAPFANEGLEKDMNGEGVQEYGVPDISLKKFIPEDKWYKTEGCGLWYKYSGEEAYPSVGVDYAFRIDVANTFEENVDTLVTEAIDESWKKISPISDEDAGRPFTMYDGFPLIFMRENKKLNTIEYALAEFGGGTFFMNFYVHEK